MIPPPYPLLPLPPPLPPFPKALRVIEPSPITANVWTDATKRKAAYEAKCWYLGDAFDPSTASGAMAVDEVGGTITIGATTYGDR